MGQLHVPALTLGPGLAGKTPSLSSRSLKYSRNAGHPASSLSGIPECSMGLINNVCVCVCSGSQEKEEWCCLGLGKCVYFAGEGEILFPHWKPRGQFLHILIWHNNICKIFYCPQIIREGIHMA